ncbi:hypothetical protein RIF29_39092 [Crotalaria pallida]|uniref:Uncharacterized protein n=1 Tax=Crotalaria pallida TaxID=3830 RepID=A0AAN9E0L0_CROPI
MVVISGGEALTTGFTNSVAHYGKDYDSALIEVVRVWVKLDDVSQKHDGGVNEDHVMQTHDEQTKKYFQAINLALLRIEGREIRIEYIFIRKVAGVSTKFRYKELEEATNGFQAVIVKVSFASVFKGILSIGIVVAAKRSDEERGDEERGEREFRLEVAAIVGVQHVNHFKCHGRLIFTQIVKAYCTWLRRMKGKLEYATPTEISSKNKNASFLATGSTSMWGRRKDEEQLLAVFLIAIVIATFVLAMVLFAEDLSLEPFKIIYEERGNKYYSFDTFQCIVPLLIAAAALLVAGGALLLECIVPLCCFASHFQILYFSTIAY